ncbi:MAG: aminotransferase class I/II-fold pyridoxal phosphate-dependent enzyme [Planctomycetaceae bacterium]|jgi:histidinol-phosphate/aromatic aminotransferase/cobyric acid decarboxylase-like protein/choline kinase|nr:aminotransferase class I/II-fold pyridoxal phosphate-dependent enzyme [Planctomycetaceae bacterium]
MQALILAAGMGKRLGELTADRTKCMVELLGKPLLIRLLEQLERLTIDRVTIVTGYCGEDLRKRIGNRFGRLEINYIDNHIFDRTNNIYSLYLARNVLLDDDTILFESDLVFDDAVIARLLADQRPNLAVVAKYQSWMDGTVLTLNENDEITGFISKGQFDFNRLNDYYKTVNVYRFSKEFSQSHYIPFLEAYCKAMGHNEYYEQVLRILTFLDNPMPNRPTLKALRLDREKWYEIDDIQDLANAATLFATGEEELASYHSRYGGYWRFPFLTDYCYLVNPFFPPQRLIDEIKSQFETLLTQYPSGQSVNRLLAAKMFDTRPEQIVVGNGAAELIQSIQRNYEGVTGIVRPSFEEYGNRTPTEKLRLFTANGTRFSYTVEELVKFCETESVDRLVLINPDNPTGHYLSFADVSRLAKTLQTARRELIIDESFGDFAEEQRTFIGTKVLEEHPNVTVVKSISKSYGVPGLRLGVAASANVERMKNAGKDVSIWNINSFGEFFMQIIGKYESEYKKACGLLIEERKRFGQRLAATEKLRLLPSQANYFFCEVFLPETPENLTQRLLRNHNILIRNCQNKSGIEAPYIRLAIRTPQENDRLVKAVMDAE